MARYFFDTEFLESGVLSEPLHLLSLGIVCDDGREMYWVNGDCPVDKASDWVKANVLPSIDWRDAISQDGIKRALKVFVREAEPEWWSLNAAYDWACLCGLFGKMIDIPDTWPHYCNDIKQLERQLGKPGRPERTDKDHHHALSDARWHRLLYEHYVKLAKRIKLTI